MTVTTLRGTRNDLARRYLATPARSLAEIDHHLLSARARQDEARELELLLEKYAHSANLEALRAAGHTLLAARVEAATAQQ